MFFLFGLLLTQKDKINCYYILFNNKKSRKPNKKNSNSLKMVVWFLAKEGVSQCLHIKQGIYGQSVYYWYFIVSRKYFVRRNVFKFYLVSFFSVFSFWTVNGTVSLTKGGVKSISTNFDWLFLLKLRTHFNWMKTNHCCCETHV